MQKSRIIILGIAVILGFISIFGFVVWQPTIIRRVPYPAPEPAYHSWDEILSNPQPITIRTYSTGIMQTTRSAIMNLEHEKAQDIEDVSIEIPVNVGIIQHQELGAYLIDAGLDKSYVHNPHGTICQFADESKPEIRGNTAPVNFGKAAPPSGGVQMEIAATKNKQKVIAQ